MSLPKITINRANGAIGSVPINNDGETLMVFAARTGTAAWHTTVPGIYTSYEAFKTKNPDLTYSDRLMRFQIELHIRHFFMNNNGQRLHVLLVPQTENFNTILSGTSGTTVANYIRLQNGDIKLVGLFINPSALPTYDVNFLPTNFASSAAFTINNFAQSMDVEGYPFHVFVGFYPSTMSTATLKPRTLNAPRLTMVAYRHHAEYQAAIANWTQLQAPNATEAEVLRSQSHLGYVLGVIAGLPVQRNLARVANGPLNLGGQSTISDTNWTLSEDEIVGSGWLTQRQHVGLPGHYFNDDVTSTVLSDDFAWIHRNRIANKAEMIARRVYLTKLNSEVAIDPTTGRLSALEAKSLEQLLIQAIDSEMIQKGELVATDAYIDPNQDVLTTSTINVVLKLLPYAHAKYINVVVSFAKTL